MRDLGQSYAWLADAQLRARDLTEDLRNRLAERSLYGEMLKQQPDDNQALEALAVNDMAVANVRDLQGDRAAALTEIGACVDRYRTLLAIDRQNTTYQARYARALIKQANYLLEADKLPEASTAARQALAVSSRLVAVDPGSLSWQGELLGGARLSQILIAARSARNTPALEGILARADDEAKRLSALAPRKPTDRALARVLAEDMVISGDGDLLGGHTGAARSSWAKAGNILDRAGIKRETASPADMSLLDLVSSRNSGDRVLNNKTYEASYRSH